MRKFRNLLLTLLIVTFIIFSLSGFNTSRGIDDLAYALAIGIDKRI